MSTTVGIGKHVGSLRYRTCPDCGEMHDVNAWPENHRTPGEVIAAPMVIRDGLDDLLHPCDDRRYDSKRAFRSTTRAFGREEIGNDPIKDKRWVDKITNEEVATAMHMVQQGYKPHPQTADATDMASIIP